MSRCEVSFWRAAALGFWVMAVFNAALVGYAAIQFVLARPDYFARAWPTFSRLLSGGDTGVYKVLAAAGGAGLFLGAAAVARMQWHRARRAMSGRVLLWMMAACAALAAALGIVHYVHVSVHLKANAAMHMRVSYLFFSGMTLAIFVNVLLSRCLAHRTPEARAARNRFTAHERVGSGVFGAGLLFLLTFILKDVPSNPWGAQTQKVFVMMELSWAILTHAYALMYVKPVRGYFERLRADTSMATRRTGALAGAVAAFWLVAAWPAADTFAAAAGGAVGGSGRIQPAGGIVSVTAPGGRMVEHILVREGERVRKGAVLLVLAEHPVRVLEREVAAERLRAAEVHAVEHRKTLEIEIESARLTLAQARAEATAAAALDERTLPAREKRQRTAAVAQAGIALQLATARQAEARKASDAELRIARMNLKLADAALASARLVSPVDATVLEVHVQPGSSAGAGPAITLADTSTMYVVANFFEGDLPRLNAGQRVRISNAALGQPLDGTVERIGRVVDTVNRLAKVWVKLDKPAPADRFIGMQVDVKVETDRLAAGKAARP